MFYFVDPQGRLVDENLQPLPDGQEGPGSIFHVASGASKATRHDAQTGLITSAADLLKAAKHHGFERHNSYKTSNVYLNLTDDPKEKSRPPTPPPSGPVTLHHQIPEGLAGHVTCSYCWAVIRDKERWKGYTMAELTGAARQGCGACDILQKCIRHFANLLFPTYHDDKVRVCQSDNLPLKLLSQTKKVKVTFEEHGGETISMQFAELSAATQCTETISGRIKDTSSEMAHDLIKSWLTNCSASHDGCAIPQASVLPRRVLCVSGPVIRLLETRGQRAPYVTLSHCWGLHSMTTVTTATLEAMKTAVPWVELTRTFQEAVMITRKLGFDYLWIDGLCILQDDQKDWEIEVSNMARIFADSQLTIAASRAKDGSQGCYSTRSDEPYYLRCSNDREIRHPELWQPYHIEGLDRDRQRRTFTVSLGFPHGLFRHKRPVEPLLKRAWVFQEQILSPRVIHYAGSELFFECKTHIACECSGWNLRSQSWDWETRWRKAHRVLMNRDMSTKSAIGYVHQQRREFEAYKTLIETYTELDITNDLDRLPALSGLSLGRDDEYLAGMWRGILPLTLHWVPSTGNPRGNMARRPHEYRAPTWSWASMEAPIRHIGANAANSPFDAKITARVLDVSCTPEGVDPRGRVRDCSLRLQGSGCFAQVIQIGICERKAWGPEAQLEMIAQTNPGAVDRGLLEHEQSKLCTYALLQKDSADMNGGEEQVQEQQQEALCYLDVPLVLARTMPAEVAVGDDVLCFVVSEELCLILTRSSTAPSIFYRVGVLRSQAKAWDMQPGVVTIY